MGHRAAPARQLAMGEHRSAQSPVAEAPPSPGIEYGELSAFLGAQRAKFDELRCVALPRRLRSRDEELTPPTGPSVCSIACQQKHRELAKLTSDCRQLEEEQSARGCVPVPPPPPLGWCPAMERRRCRAGRAPSPPDAGVGPGARVARATLIVPPVCGTCTRDPTAFAATRKPSR